MVVQEQWYSLLEVLVEKKSGTDSTAESLCIGNNLLMEICRTSYGINDCSNSVEQLLQFETAN